LRQKARAFSTQCAIDAALMLLPRYLRARPVRYSRPPRYDGITAEEVRATLSCHMLPLFSLPF